MQIKEGVTKALSKIVGEMGARMIVDLVLYPLIGVPLGILAKNTFPSFFGALGKALSIEIPILYAILSAIGAILTYHAILVLKNRKPIAVVDDVTDKDKGKDKPPNYFHELIPIKDKSLFSEKPTLSEIETAINDQPAYMQDIFAKSFEGLKVHWVLPLNYIITHNERYISASFGRFINGAIDTKEYPEIKTAKKGTAFDVWAELLDVSPGSVNLGIHDIRLHAQPSSDTKPDVYIQRGTVDDIAKDY